MEEHDYDLDEDAAWDDENRFDEPDWDDYDGQPDEYTEWQDFMGGDEYYDHSEAQEF